MFFLFSPLIPLTHMIKYPVGNGFFVFSYPVVCQLEIKLSLVLLEAHGDR